MIDRRSFIGSLMAICGSTNLYAEEPPKLEEYKETKQVDKSRAKVKIFTSIGVMTLPMEAISHFDYNAQLEIKQAFRVLKWYIVDDLTKSIIKPRIDYPEIDVCAGDKLNFNYHNHLS